MKVKLIITKSTALLLSVSFIFAVGCASDTSVLESEKENGESETSDTLTETTDIYSDLPVENFDGYVFRIFNSTYDWALYNLDSEEMNGEAFNDAIFDRNRSLEELLNIKLEINETEYYEKSASKLNTLILAGDDEYDAACLPVFNAAPNAGENYYLNLYDIKSIDLEKPWWNQRTQEYYELNGKLYWAHGEAQINYYDCLWALFFNTKLVDDLKLENPYDLVENGTWTISKFYGMVKDASADLNSDGKLDENDRLGFASHSGVSFGFLHGCNERAINISNGNPSLSDMSERLIDSISKIQEILTSDYVYMQAGQVKNELFSQDKALFFGETLGNAASLRQMIANFGLLPFPKYDDEQKEYVGYMSPAGLAFFIPTTVKSAERSGAVLECMNALSNKTVLPAYYEVVLGEKHLRDDTSKNILNILLDSAECELAFIYKWNGYNNTMVSVLSSETAISSTLESAREATKAAISAFMDKIH